MVAHFMNNGFTLMMLYLYNNGAVDIDIESTATVPWYQVGIGALITTVLIIGFKRFFSSQEENEELG